VIVDRPAVMAPDCPMPDQSVAADPASNASEVARYAQFLTTEHLSLLTTRSMTWSEAFARTAMFVSCLAAATVALALAGPAMGFSQAFLLFALIVLSVVLFLGIATYVRLLQVNNEDLYWVTGMNMIRAAYARLAPGVESDFATGSTLDPEGIARSFGAFDMTRDPSPFRLLLTTPGVVAVISSTVAGVIAGLVAHELGTLNELAVSLGITVFVFGVFLGVVYGRMNTRRYITRSIEMRLPNAQAIDGDPAPHT